MENAEHSFLGESAYATGFGVCIAMVILSLVSGPIPGLAVIGLQWIYYCGTILMLYGALTIEEPKRDLAVGLVAA